jgi:precorrin-6B methylase 2
MTGHIDWREAWIQRNRKRPTAGNAEFWNGRAKDFEKKGGVSEYVKLFLELLAPAPGDSIVDVGCGSGALALPLAQAGHEVLALDFAPRMLATLETARAKAGLTNLKTQQLDWTEDWLAAGIEPKSKDIAIASRSTMVNDLADAFTKLNTVARSRVAVTMATELGPRGTQAAYEAVGRRREPADYLYGLNLLIQMGLHPTLDYIVTARADCFTSVAEAHAYYRPLDASAEEEARLASWLQEHLIEDASNGPDGAKPFRMDIERVVRWAFLAWNVPA